MGSRALLLLRGANGPSITSFSNSQTSLISRTLSIEKMKKKKTVRGYSGRASLEPPNVPRLAETARISLTPDEVEEFAPKIHQVVDWFGQLQAVDLQSVDPAIRADTDGQNVRDDVPETFQNREAMINAVPSCNEPYIKVPKVLNKE